MLVRKPTIRCRFLTMQRSGTTLYILCNNWLILDEQYRQKYTTLKIFKHTAQLGLAETVGNRHFVEKQQGDYHMGVG